MSGTDAVPVSEARGRLAAIIDQTRENAEPVYLSRRGKRVAAVIDAATLDRIIALAEDMADLHAVAEARAEMEATGAEPIPWEDVKADLGLT